MMPGYIGLSFATWPKSIAASTKSKLLKVFKYLQTLDGGEQQAFCSSNTGRDGKARFSAVYDALPSAQR